MDLPSVGATVVTVSGADAAGAVPVLVDSALVVLVTVPGVLDVMPTTIVQPPVGIADPDDIVIVVDVTETPPQVPVLAVVVVTPAGMVSTSAAVSEIGDALLLPTKQRERRRAADADGGGRDRLAERRLAADRCRSHCCCRC